MMGRFEASEGGKVMRRLAARWVLGLLLVCGGSASAGRGEEGAFPSSDEQLLRRAKMPTDTEGLLAYLRTLSASAATERMVQDLVRELGAGEFAQRERAAQRLVGLGRLALPVLRKNVDNEDAEIAQRAKACIAEIDRLPWLNLPLIVTRLLVQRKVEEAVPVLLEYLGHTGDPDVEEEIYYCLDELAVRDSRIHPALVAALTDANPARRAVAGCILGRVGNANQREGVRKLLEDPDARVRLRSAQGLLTSREKAAVPVLVGLLDEAVVEIAWQAEELLHWIAGETSPEIAVGAASAAERRRCQQAWERWWEERKGEVDWETAERDCRRPGLVLSWHAVMDKERCIRFRLCGCDGVVRFGFERQLQGCHWLSDSGLWTGKGLLLPVREPAASPKEEIDPMRLREVDLDGKTLWESQTFGVFAIPNWRRVGDGRIMVSDGIIAIELDRGGQETHRRKLASFEEDKWKKGGGQPGKTKPKDPLGHGLYVGPGVAWFGKEGRLLTQWSGKEHDYIVECDAGGGEWVAAKAKSYGKPYDLPILIEKAMEGRRGVLRLRNGHTLVGLGPIRETANASGPMELNGEGKTVWEGAPTNTPTGSVEVLCPLVRFGFQRGSGTESSLDTVPSRLRRLKSRRLVMRNRAAELLLAEEPTEEIGTAFLGLLNDPDEKVRCLGVGGVYKAKGHLSDPFRPLIELLFDPSEEVRGKAKAVLGDMGPKAIPALLAVTQDSRKPERVRADAAVGLCGYLKDPQPGVVEAVRRGMTKGSWENRREVISGLRYQEGVEVMIPELLESLRDPHEKVVCSASIVLRELGPKGEKAVPGLLKALGDRRTRVAAAAALGGIHPKNPAVIDSLIRELDDKGDKEGRRSIVASLTAYSKEDPRVIPLLIRLLDDPDLVGVVVFGLTHYIEGDAKAAVPKLAAIALDPNRSAYLREAADRALDRIQQGPGKPSREGFHTEPAERP